MQSWAKKTGDINVQMPYDTPEENDVMTTEFARLDLPRALKLDALTT